MLIYSFAVILPRRFMTLRLSGGRGMSTPPRGTAPRRDGPPHGSAFERPGRVVRYDDRAVLVERG